MAIALVSHVGLALAGTTSSINTTGATLLVAVVGYNGAPQATVSDSKSNVWQVVAGNTIQSNSGVDVYFSINPTVGTGHTFTLATANNPTFCVAAFSGTATSFVTSKSLIASSASATSLTTGNITPEVANCLMISALSNRVQTTYAVDSSYTITDQFSFIAGSQIGSALGYLVETNATAQNPSWSWTGAGVGAMINLYVQPPVASPGNILPVV
jgi:hypothetical protein